MLPERTACGNGSMVRFSCTCAVGDVGRVVSAFQGRCGIMIGTMIFVKLYLVGGWEYVTLKTTMHCNQAT
jgi:hypothetical protein